MTPQRSRPLDLDLSRASLSQHERLALIDGAMSLIHWIGEERARELNLVVPVNGGRRTYILKKPARGTENPWIVYQFPSGESQPEIEYGKSQTLSIICREKNALRKCNFMLSGALNALDHALILTALGGFLEGVRLKDLLISHRDAKRYKLEYIQSHGEMLMDRASGAPLLSDTLDPFVENVRCFLRAQALPSENRKRN